MFPSRGNKLRADDFPRFLVDIDVQFALVYVHDMRPPMGAEIGRADDEMVKLIIPFPNRAPVWVRKGDLQRNTPL
jgi:hypothetical protein